MCGAWVCLFVCVAFQRVEFFSELSYSPTDRPEGLKMLPQSVARFGATAGL